MVLRGSSLPFYANGEFCVRGRRFLFLGKARIPDRRITSKELADFALSYLNSPYRWGGRTPFGIDCASFVQVVFKAFGVYLPRETYNQKERGKEIGSITDAQVGDLAFFRSISKDLPHAGIVLGEEIIHACGTVRIDSIDKAGIFNQEMNKYTYRFTGIRRITNVV
jgi:cell wall-associated NlpC family hydrolase